MKLFVKWVCLCSIIFFTSCSSKNPSNSNLSCFINPQQCSSKLTVSSSALMIKILGPRTPPPVVNADILNLVGVCNEGAYPDNYIKWWIKLANTTKLYSGTTELKCKEGRFKLSINTSAIIKNIKSVEYVIEMAIYGFDYNAKVVSSTVSRYSIFF